VESRPHNLRVGHQRPEQRRSAASLGTDHDEARLQPQRRRRRAHLQVRTSTGPPDRFWCGLAHGRHEKFTSFLSLWPVI
jgi:hypothetical protein